MTKSVTIWIQPFTSETVHLHDPGLFVRLVPTLPKNCDTASRSVLWLISLVQWQHKNVSAVAIPDKAGT